MSVWRMLVGALAAHPARCPRSYMQQCLATWRHACPPAWQQQPTFPAPPRHPGPRHLSTRSPQGKKVVAVALSGGVDSAVAAHLLQRAGHDVFGVFMRNWDEREEVGNQNCSVEADFKDAQAVARHLGMPLYEADFVSQYWNEVFVGFLEQCRLGLTPNPDLACNRHIKFGHLVRFAQRLGADCVATGGRLTSEWLVRSFPLLLGT